MYLKKLDILYLCISIVVYRGVFIVICKNLRKFKNFCMVWKNDCGLRLGIFFVFF